MPSTSSPHIPSSFFFFSFSSYLYSHALISHLPLCLCALKKSKRPFPSSIPRTQELSNLRPSRAFSMQVSFFHLSFDNSLRFYLFLVLSSLVHPAKIRVVVSDCPKTNVLASDRFCVRFVVFRPWATKNSNRPFASQTTQLTFASLQSL